MPIETGRSRGCRWVRLSRVAFTPKGGCPLKQPVNLLLQCEIAQLRSIHPQGWVPIETLRRMQTPVLFYRNHVAFTPKGGCPLKQVYIVYRSRHQQKQSSIHPQGWVPIETNTSSGMFCVSPASGSSIHPQGWVPIEIAQYPVNAWNNIR